MSSILFILFWYVVSCSNAENGGFSSMLYHRDHNLPKMDRLSKAMDRDLARVNRSTITPNTLVSDIKYGGGSYMMKLALGTPPYEFFASADTGGKQTWIQCQPCKNCFHQNSPIFDPAQSITYQAIACHNTLLPCPKFQGVICVNNLCSNLVVYVDGRFSKGVLSTDLMTIQSTSGQPIKVAHYIFGCGQNNVGNFSPEQAGIIGLGRGPRSLITQLDKYINGRFSYCLSPQMQGGKIHFGDDAVVQGHGVVTTPIIPGKGIYYDYYLATLEALTIGNERLEFNANPGNIIIDSGATLTHFPPAFYKRVLGSLLRQITAKRVPDPTQRLKVCYRYVKGSFKSVPITAHFAGGADVVLNAYNMFQRVAPSIICLFIIEGPKAIWGNTAQLDFLIGFNVVTDTVSFKFTVC